MLNFWIGIIILLFGWAGIDRMMTGVVKPDIETNVFRVYVLWFTLINQAVAYLVSSTYYYTSVNPSYIVALLMWITITWTWIGGSLDFIYWMMAGRLPDFNEVLWWMPFSPKLWQWGIYALCWIVGLAVAWSVLV